MKYQRMVLWYVSSCDLGHLLPCSTSEYSCRNGHCVRQEQLCDGKNDCGDASDEISNCGKGMVSYSN